MESAWLASHVATIFVIVRAGKFTLKMRTSFFNSYSGFQISVICFKREGKKLHDILIII